MAGMITGRVLPLYTGRDQVWDLELMSQKQGSMEFGIPPCVSSSRGPGMLQLTTCGVKSGGPET